MIFQNYQEMFSRNYSRKYILVSDYRWLTAGKKFLKNG